MRNRLLLLAAIATAVACFDHPAPVEPAGLAPLAGGASLHTDEARGVFLETAPISYSVRVGTASFGMQVGDMPGWSLSGSVVAAVDEANSNGPTTADACTAVTNGAALAGNIAIAERGTCQF